MISANLISNASTKKDAIDCTCPPQMSMLTHNPLLPCEDIELCEQDMGFHRTPNLSVS